ncbi:MAG: type II toxin-antitoxin system RelB/DinJ family antitoxin [Epsilonproteobacteria bacterium]|nr:type II toxin-antitoxin system RelB/DinJ family antitoxin [Campylobacterota bacterium]
MKNAIINARIESELKVDVEHILKNLGLSATQAINMFYQQIKLHNGIPFAVKIPNDETQRVIEESRKGVNVEDFSFDELERR